YPIVQDYAPFTDLPGADHFVLIDPAAGLSRYTVEFSDNFSTRFQTELSFLQNFRRIADGVTYEMVITGYADRPVSQGGNNVFSASATLGLSLRRYQEGTGFHEFNQTRIRPPLPVYYFLTGPRLIKNTGTSDYVASHWNI